MPRAFKPSPKPPGNQKIPIDWTVVDQMVEGDCNGAEVAARLGIHPDTLYNRTEEEKGVTWSAYLREKKAKGCSNIRLKQYQIALKGDRSMLIWLGKQRLGQKETPSEFIADEKALAQFTALMEAFTRAQAIAKAPVALPEESQEQFQSQNE